MYIFYDPNAKKGGIANPEKAPEYFAKHMYNARVLSHIIQTTKSFDLKMTAIRELAIAERRKAYWERKLETYQIVAIARSVKHMSISY